MTTTNRDAVAEAIRDTRNLSDRNGEPANNVADVIADLAHSGRQIANAILPSGVAPGHDERRPQEGHMRRKP